jgi:subtilisin
MRYSKLLRWLKRCTSAAKPEVRTRQIIRFINRREYIGFLRQLNASQPSRRLKASIHKLRLIHAVSFDGGPLPVQSYQGVRFIERDARIRMNNTSASPDEGSTIPWGVKRIRAPRAWKLTTGQGVKVAVIDTGADFSHPDLEHSLAAGINILQRSALPWDDNGHGTHISGTIAAAASEDHGVWGAAPRTVIVPVKAFDRNGSAYVSDIIQGIDWCVQHGIPIINMSFGMTSSSRAFREAVRHAYIQGTIIVASAGNDGKKNGLLDYPAQYPNTIAVGATSRHGRIAKFSNRGGRVHLYAPGNKITSTWLRRGYAALSGTSMSTSHVSGAIALALSLRPRLSPWQIRQLIYQTGRPLQGKSYKHLREVDAYRFISVVSKL